MFFWIDLWRLYMINGKKNINYIVKVFKLMNFFWIVLNFFIYVGCEVKLVVRKGGWCMFYVYEIYGKRW